jgi:hypothetical protein
MNPVKANFQVHFLMLHYTAPENIHTFLPSTRFLNINLTDLIPIDSKSFPRMIYIFKSENNV